VRDRTGLVVTHRFTTAMHADLIYVMQDHEIIESGSHEELLEEGGHYAASWRSQVESGWRAVEEDGAASSTGVSVGQPNGRGQGRG